MIIKGVEVITDCDICEEQIEQIVAEEHLAYIARNKVLGRLELTVDNGEIVIHGYSKEPIKRIARISGYLAPVDSFNDAKKAELKARVAHNYD